MTAQVHYEIKTAGTGLTDGQSDKANPPPIKQQMH
jgi:hypothetical protein